MKLIIILFIELQGMIFDPEDEIQPEDEARIQIAPIMWSNFIGSMATGN